LEAAPLRPAASLGTPQAPAREARESVDDLLTHLQEQPTDVAARLVLAGVYEEREDYPRALDQYRLLIKSREVPGHVLDLVLDNLRTLAEDMPDDPAVHRVLGDAYRKVGMFQAAISQYNWLLSHGTK
jgi:tetratricopeptide (TPR) repeat protein